MKPSFAKPPLYCWLRHGLLLLLIVFFWSCVRVSAQAPGTPFPAPQTQYSKELIEAQVLRMNFMKRLTAEAEVLFVAGSKDRENTIKRHVTLQLERYDKFILRRETPKSAAELTEGLELARKVIRDELTEATRVEASRAAQREATSALAPGQVQVQGVEDLRLQISSLTSQLRSVAQTNLGLSQGVTQFSKDLGPILATLLASANSLGEQIKAMPLRSNAGASAPDPRLNQAIAEVEKLKVTIPALEKLGLLIPRLEQLAANSTAPGTIPRSPNTQPDTITPELKAQVQSVKASLQDWELKSAKSVRDLAQVAEANRASQGQLVTAVTEALKTPRVESSGTNGGVRYIAASSLTGPAWGTLIYISLVVMLILGAVIYCYFELAAKTAGVAEIAAASGAASRQAVESMAQSVQTAKDSMESSVARVVESSVIKAVQESLGAPVEAAQAAVGDAGEILEQMNAKLQTANERLQGLETHQVEFQQFANSEGKKLKAAAQAESAAISSQIDREAMEAARKIKREASELRDLMDQIKGLTNDKALVDLARQSGELGTKLAAVEKLAGGVGTTLQDFNSELKRVVEATKQEVATVDERLQKMNQQLVEVCSTTEQQLTAARKTTNEEVTAMRSAAAQVMEDVSKGLRQLAEAFTDMRTTVESQAKEELTKELKAIEEQNAQMDKGEWPKPFERGMALDPSRERIKARAGEGDEDAIQLRAELFSLQALLRGASVDPDQMAQALASVSTAAYQFWRVELKEDMDAIQDVAHLWETELNKLLKDRNIPLSISAPIPNTPFDLATMLAVRSTTGADFRVKEPLSWTIISTAQGRQKLVSPGRVVTE